jgi:hypothetical protein
MQFREALGQAHAKEPVWIDRGRMKLSANDDSWYLTR